MDGKEVIVYGWYGHGNIGDEAFKDCFRHLWPSINFTFSDALPPDANEEYDALWVGGGSFLDDAIPGIEKISIPICFVGVGAGGRKGPNIHPNNLDAVKRAKAVVARDASSAATLAAICSPAAASDLVFSLPPATVAPPSNKITVLLNSFVVPTADQERWRHLSHEWFQWEFRDFCKEATLDGTTIDFVPMYVSDDGLDDRTAAAMIRPGIHSVSHGRKTLPEARALMSSRLVITQRLHGAILAFIQGTPFVCVSHHDKMRAFCDEVGVSSVDYYGFSKDALKRALRAYQPPPGREQYIEEARRRWKELSAIVERESFS